LIEVLKTLNNDILNEFKFNESEKLKIKLITYNLELNC